MTMRALEVKGLCKAYEGLVVTDNVDLQLEVGARHALIGPNGAGKSTLVHLISGIIRADAGTVSLFGKPITHLSPAARAKMGLARTFQISNLFPSLSVLENVFIAVCQHKGEALNFFQAAGKRRDLLEQAEAILVTFSLKHLMHRPISQLAYGEQRLVDMALAWASEPKVLLLDEPAAGIPTSEINILLEAIKRLPVDIALLIIEHDMEIVRQLADTVTVLVQGSVLISGPSETVMSSSKVHEVYLGNGGAGYSATGETCA